MSTDAPLTDTEIAAIEARMHEAARNAPGHDEAVCSGFKLDPLVKDIARLLAEVQRMRRLLDGAPVY